MALVQLEAVDNQIVKLTLNDPDNLNAMSEVMAQEFKQTVTQLKTSNPGYRVLILCGAGRAFSAGGQLEMLEKKIKKTEQENYLEMLNFYNSFLAILDLEIPLVAAIQGPAIGAGLCLAAACDIRIAAENAKLGFTFTRLGLYPGMGATYFVPRILGSARASELMLTARVINAAEGLRIGLLSKVVAEVELLGQAQVLAKEILACGSLATKQLLATLRADPNQLKACLEAEARAQSISYASSEFAEGLKAVKQKR